MADKIKPNTPVRATTHPGDTRSNIPTAELESFARPEEKRPAIVRYPRNPDLDPQLVWKGKDEQDSHDLEVPAVPIYIQETIDPLALVEELRAESQGRQTEEQLGFFAPYTDLTFEEKVEFYRHPGKWSNRMILGDSLLVMTSLAEKEGLKGQVQTIYIDPPYGIKFGSNWQVSTRKRRRNAMARTRTYAPARAGARLPRHVGTRDPLVPELPARPLARRSRTTHRVGLGLRPDRRREHAPRSQSCSMRYSDPRTSCGHRVRQDDGADKRPSTAGTDSTTSSGTHVTSIG